MEYLQFSSYDIFTKAISIIIGYTFGSIPFGLFLTHISGIEDIRHIGSGNIGATNVLRTGNKKIAFMTLILDVIKATCSVIIASTLFNDTAGELAGFAAFLGHIFPIWLKFKGGKGVSTYVGVLIALNPNIVMFFASIWILCLLVTYYSSLSSLLATAITLIAIWIISSEINIPIIFTIMTAIVYWKHISNIKRLISGSETKIILRKSNNNEH
ncbi:MAG: acyl-phosphate glycerol 3-phosphate acyltransferase [Candidatus Liberibacter europaeus]|uniref:Glycerol-3-phosphate acyltransferase n=1 Tax=Candidatus Liberibacter europaeus TaxID=744859 RepID=A0A2T4VXX2_9HYPH|nr:acyl-phosphate glycerol 3-phosphate acyltransferase [Candidatus Liberibacter europaeus]PTL86625.1 MAG: acyl-phosphate glycerol 3-phosphate acyltransferase [Candidatus Liberibacter europaeus]